MATATICSDFAAQGNKVCHCLLFPYLFAMKWWDQMPCALFFECWVLSQFFHSCLSLSSRGSPGSGLNALEGRSHEPLFEFPTKSTHMEAIPWWVKKISLEFWSNRWMRTGFSLVKNLPAVPGWGRSLEEEMETHSSILAWEVPWTEETGRLQSMGVTKELDTTEWLNNNKDEWRYSHCTHDRATNTFTEFYKITGSIVLCSYSWSFLVPISYIQNISNLFCSVFHSLNPAVWLLPEIWKPEPTFWSFFLLVL